MLRNSLLLLVILVGCGRTSNYQEVHEAVSLQLRLPAALARNSGRYRRFLERAAYLELSVETKSGQDAILQFVPGVWEGLSIPSIRFPAFAEDVLTARVRVFDKRRDGATREYPVLSGKGQLAAKELQKGGASTLSVNLSMHVSVGEYD